jgi:hypothetical protein
MTTFAIDTDNTITAYLAGDQIPDDQARFTSEKELLKLAANWPPTAWSRSGTASPACRPSATSSR